MDATEIVPLTREGLAALLARREASGQDEGFNGRRRYPRWPFPGTVELWIPDDTGGEGYALATCENLGLGGVGIRCPEPLKPGLELAIAIHQPERSFHGRARVRHCTQFPQGYYCGLEFAFES